MCNVCVAERALWAGSCRKDSCMAYSDGAEFRWDDAPAMTWEQTGNKGNPLTKALAKLRPASAKLRTRTCEARPVVFVRARGKGAECKPAQYQIRRMNEDWPKKWERTSDLAGVFGMYGFDVKWEFVRKDVRKWILRERRRLPTEPEMDAEIRKRKRKVVCAKCGAKGEISEDHPKGWTERMEQVKFGKPRRPGGAWAGTAMTNRQYCPACSSSTKAKSS